MPTLFQGLIDDFDYYDAAPETKPADPICYCCGKDLDSELQCSPLEAAEILVVLKRRIQQPDVTECEALAQGLICTDCVEKKECPHCGQLGGELIDGDSGIAERCSLCIPRLPEYEPEDDLERARRRPPVFMPARLKEVA